MQEWVRTNGIHSLGDLSRDVICHDVRACHLSGVEAARRKQPIMTMYQDKWEQSIVSKRKQQIIGHSEGSLINSWDAPP